MVSLGLRPRGCAPSLILTAVCLLLTVGAARGEGAAHKAAPAPDAGPAAANPGPPPPPKLPWEDEIQAFEHADKERTKKRKTTAPVVFMGSSSIRLWDSLAKDFPYHHVLNRGFGGSQISDNIRFADRILARYKPPLIVFYAGTNDINAGKSAITVSMDFKAFTAKVWSLFPDVHIAFISIGPSPSRWTQAAKVREANKLIAAECASNPKLHFIDIFGEMLGSDGKPRPELYLQDHLHMTREGYELWIPHIRATVDKVTPPARARITK